MPRQGREAAGRACAARGDMIRRRAARAQSKNATCGVRGPGPEQIPSAQKRAAGERRNGRPKRRGVGWGRALSGGGVAGEGDGGGGKGDFVIKTRLGAQAREEAGVVLVACARVGLWAALVAGPRRRGGMGGACGDRGGWKEKGGQGGGSTRKTQGAGHRFVFFLAVCALFVCVSGGTRRAPWLRACGLFCSSAGGAGRRARGAAGREGKRKRRSERLRPARRDVTVPGGPSPGGGEGRRGKSRNGWGD